MNGLVYLFAKESGQTSDREGRAERRQAKQRAEQRHARINQIVDKPRGGVRDGRKEGRTQGAFAQALVDFVENLLRFVLVAERRNHFMVADIFVDHSGLLGACFGLQLEHRVGSGSNEGGNEQRQRRDENHHKRNRGLDGQHDDQRSENGQNAGKKLVEAKEKPVGKLVDVVDHAAQKSAGGAAVEIGKRQALQLFKRFPPQTVDQMVRHAVVQNIHAPLRERGDQSTDPDRNADAGYARQINRIRTEHFVDGVSHQKRHGKRQKRTHRRAEQGRDQNPAGGADQTEHPLGGFDVKAALLFLLFLSHIFHASAPSFLYWES